MTTLTIYYDYTDPWSYLAVFRADWLRDQVDGLAVHWHPFELYPDLPARGARPQNPAFLRRKTQYDIDEKTRELGLTVKIHVPHDRVYNSRLALEGSLFARAVGEDAFDRYHRALFAAFFERQADIATPEAVAAIGGEAGLDTANLSDALRSQRYTDEVVRLRSEAEAFGVAAIPTFVANNHGVVGIVAPERLLRVVTTASLPVLP